jgi:hypothetical protein
MVCQERQFLAASLGSLVLGAVKQPARYEMLRSASVSSGVPAVIQF